MSSKSDTSIWYMILVSSGIVAAFVGGAIGWFGNKYLAKESYKKKAARRIVEKIELLESHGREYWSENYIAINRSVEQEIKTQFLYLAQDINAYRKNLKPAMATSADILLIKFRSSITGGLFETQRRLRNDETVKLIQESAINLREIYVSYCS